MNDEKMKSYLKERLDDYRHQVDDALWSSLEGSLPEGRKRSLKRPLIASVSIAAVIVLGIFLFVPSGEDSTMNNPVTEDYRPDVEPAQSDDSSEEDATTPAIIEQDIIKKMPKAITKEPVLIAEIEIPVPEDDNFDITVEIEEEPSGDEKTTEDTSSPAKVRPSGRQQNNGQYQIFPYERYDRRNRNLALNIGYNGNFSQDSGNSADVSPGAPIYGADGEPIEMVTPVYDFPVSFSITVRKGLAKNFSFESGLTYTYLHTRDSGGDTDIKLHYLGIPVKGIYTFYDNRRLSFYATTGAMVEKQVAGKLKNSSGEKSLVYSGLQWSVGASAGLNLKLSDHIGLFAEPGVNYFFDDRSNIPTIRKDKPLNFSLQIGLRFNID